jgi:hypothetical protein
MTTPAPAPISTATFTLDVPEPGRIYSLSLWWPAAHDPAFSTSMVVEVHPGGASTTTAPPTAGTAAAAATATATTPITTTTTTTTTTVNLQTGGDEWAPIAVDVQLEAGATVVLTCPPAQANPTGTGTAAPALCVADAVLVESRARYNDGSAVSAPVEIASMDAVVLEKVPAPLGCKSQP